MILVLPLDTCACGLSVFADPDIGSYDENGQYHCSKHCQEQPTEEQEACSSNPSPGLRTLLEQHVEALHRKQQEQYREVWQQSGKVLKG